MADIINLRMARKARRRDAASRAAVENRARFGQTRAERAQALAQATRLDRTVEGARRTPPPAPDGGEAPSPDQPAAPGGKDDS